VSPLRAVQNQNILSVAWRWLCYYLRFQKM